MTEPAPEQRWNSAIGSKSGNQPTYWQAFGGRCMGCVYAFLVLIVLVSQGAALVPLQHVRDVRYSDDPAFFFVALAMDCYIVLASWFYAPYHRWNFTLKLPDYVPVEGYGPDAGYEGYKQPPKKIGPLNLPPFHMSEILDPALGKSLLLMVWTFGLMLSLLGAVQLFQGTFLVSADGGITTVDYTSEPARFVQILCIYAMLLGGTLILGILLFFWRPVRMPKLNLGRPPGGNVR